MNEGVHSNLAVPTPPPAATAYQSGGSLLERNEMCSYKQREDLRGPVSEWVWAEPQTKKKGLEPQSSQQLQSSYTELGVSGWGSHVGSSCERGVYVWMKLTALLVSLT